MTKPQPKQALSLAPEVSAFVQSNNLTPVIDQAFVELKKSFGPNADIKSRILDDPEEPTEMLMVEVLVEDLKLGRKSQTKFNNDWWYSNLPFYGHLLGFRISKARGL